MIAPANNLKSSAVELERTTPSRGRTRTRTEPLPAGDRDRAALASPRGRQRQASAPQAVGFGRAPAPAEPSRAELPRVVAARLEAALAMEPKQQLPGNPGKWPSVAGRVQPPGARLPIVIESWLSELPNSAFLPNLSFRKKCTLINEALRLDTTLDYSTAALVLALSRRARQREAQSFGEVRFADVLDTLPMGEYELVKTYRGGTCFSLTGHLMDHLSNKFKVPSYALITEYAPLQMSFWPSLIEDKSYVALQDIKNHVEHIGHTDVVVPYMAGADRRVLVLPTGQEPSAPYVDESLAERRSNFGLERLIGNPHTVAFRAVWGRVRLHISKRADNSIFGLNFLSSTMFINTQAAHALQLLMGGSAPAQQEGPFDRSFSFAGLPRRDALPMTQEAEADWQRCYVYLTLVNRLFNLGSEALSDIVHLIDRRDSYLQDAVHPYAVAFRDTCAVREKVLKMRRDLERSEHKHPRTAKRAGVPDALRALRTSLQTAQSFVVEGQVEEAHFAYGRALGVAEGALTAYAGLRGGDDTRA